MIHTIDQKCNGELSCLKKNIRNKYVKRLRGLVNKHFSDDEEKDALNISSCNNDDANNKLNTSSYNNDEENDNVSNIIFYEENDNEENDVLNTAFNTSIDPFKNLPIIELKIEKMIKNFKKTNII